MRFNVEIELEKDTLPKDKNECKLLPALSVISYSDILLIERK